MQLSWVVESLLPTLLHLTLFLFLAGLLIFLFNINHTVFGTVAGWIGFSTAMYGCVTLLPIVRHDSPYYTPLSSTAWFLYASTRYMVSRGFFCFGVETNKRVDRLAGVDKAAEETAKKRSSAIDRRVLQLTFDALDEDHAREQFFDAVPGFYRSNVVKHPQLDLSFLFQFKFRRTLDEFLDRTLSSNSISESLRVNRLLICLNAAQAACGPSTASRVLDDIFDGRWPKVLLSVEIGHYLGRWSNSNNGLIAMCARSIVSCIIINAPRRDDRWLSLVMDQLGVSERVLRLYLSNGNSVLLANLIHAIRHNIYSDYPLSHILPSLCKFNVEHTLPDLQHQFCDLWNAIVLETRNSKVYSDLVPILGHIHHIYLTLHPGTDPVPATSSSHSGTLRQRSAYPFCNITGHRSSLLAQVHEAVVEGTPQPTHTRSITLIPESMHTSQHPTAELSHGDVLEEPRRSDPIATSSRPTSSFAKSEPHPDYFVGIAATSQDGSDISTISPVTNPIPRPSSGSRAASQIQAENITISLMSGSLSSTIPALSLSGNTVPAELPSSTDSAVRLSDDIPYPITSPTSSPTTARRHISPQAPFVSGALVTARMEIVDAHGDAKDLNNPRSIESSPSPTAAGL